MTSLVLGLIRFEGFGFNCSEGTKEVSSNFLFLDDQDRFLFKEPSDVQNKAVFEEQYMEEVLKLDFGSLRGAYNRYE